MFLPFQRLLHNVNVLYYTVREMHNVSHISGHSLKQFNTVKHKRVSVANFQSWNIFLSHQKKRE